MNTKPNLLVFHKLLALGSLIGISATIVGVVFARYYIESLEILIRDAGFSFIVSLLPMCVVMHFFTRKHAPFSAYYGACTIGAMLLWVPEIFDLTKGMLIGMTLAYVSLAIPILKN